jgi:hypothetical protein
MNDEEISSNKYLDNDILSKAFINEYNLDICSKLAYKVMHRYVKLKNKYPYEPAIRITARYEPIYSCPVPRQNHQMDSVDRKIDEKAEYQFMNEKLTAMMRIMNSDERKCFTEKFINEKTDYQLAKIMQRSRCGTIPFVNSCIIRIILTFHLEVMADEQLDFDETENIEFDYSDYIVKNN